MGRLQNFRNVFANLKRRKVTKKHCPKCGNAEIHLSSKFDLWLLPERYICEKCGYQGPITLEIEKVE